MITNYNLRKQILLFFLLLVGSFMFGQTITPFLDPSLKFVKTVNTFNLVAERTDGKIWYSTVNTKTVLGLLDNDGTINSFTQDLLLNINALYPTDDNKVLVGGNFTTYNSTTVSARLLRLNSDGTRDFTFSASSNANEVTALYILADGKIMVGRNTQIQRLNADGTTDTSFSTITTNGKVNEFCISSSGKIFAVGTFTSVNSNTKNRAVLINSNGTIDATFNIGTGFNAEVKGIKKTTTNNLYVIGSFTSYNGISINKLVKLDETGNLNSTFHSSNTLFNDEPLTIEVSNDDKLLIGGNFTNYNNQTVKNFVSFNEDGAINTTLSIGNSFENGLIKIIKKNASGNYIITGEFVKYNDFFTNQIVKIESNGNRVSSFNFSNVFNLNSFIDYIPNPSESMYSPLTGNLIRVKRQNDKILVSEVYINNKRYSLARFNNSGLLDNTFLFNHNTLNLPSYLKFSYTRDFVFAPDGKIFLFSTNRKYNANLFSASFLKLNSDGSLDTTFSNQNYTQLNYIGGGYETENLGYIRNDNKLIWATSVHVLTSTTYKGVALTNNFNLLQPDGEFDESYISNSLDYNDDASNCNVNYYQDFLSTKILPLPNNETLAYMIGPSYCRFNGSSNNVSSGVSKSTIGRFNSNGTLATDYLNLDLYNVSHVNLYNGFLYIGGLTKNGTNGNYNGIFKKIDLATNSEVSFNHQLVLGVNTNAYKLVANTLFKDNKIYVVIWVSAVWASDGTTKIINYEIKRLNLDGTLDSTFSTLNVTKYRYNSYDYNSNGISRGENLQLELVDNPTENSFLIASRCPFTINGTYYEQAFVKVDLSSLSTVNNQFSESNFKCYPNPTNSTVNILTTNENINQINIYDMFGRLLKTQSGSSVNEKIDIQNFPNAVYLAEINTDKGNKTVKIIKQ